MGTCSLRWDDKVAETDLVIFLFLKKKINNIIAQSLIVLYRLDQQSFYDNQIIYEINFKFTW